MADDCPSAAEDATAAAAAGLEDSDSRVTRERHKCADATAASELFPSSRQDAPFYSCPLVQDAFTACSHKTTDDYHRPHHDRCVHHRQHYPSLRRPHHRSHHQSSLPNYHHHHHHRHHLNPHHLTSHRDNDSDRVSDEHDNGDSAMTDGDSQSCVTATVLANASDDEEVSGNVAGIGVVAPYGGVGGSGSGSSCSDSVGLYHLGLEIVRGVVETTTQRNEHGGVDSDGDGDSGGSSGGSSSISSSKSGAVAVIMTGGNNNTAETARVDVDIEDVDGADDSSSSRRSTPSVDDVVPEVNDRETDHDDRRRGATNVANESTTVEETKVDTEDVAMTKTLTNNGIVGVRFQGSPFRGQVRMAEDTLVGPCGKKRCADRYDSSESSDSGVAVSCGECSSSGTSDITEPGSPYSTSSDEGVAVIRGTSASPLPSPLKLAPSSQTETRPAWPWAPLLATACSTTACKRLRGEPEAGTLPRTGAADPTSRGSVKTSGKNASGQQHESQGKITEYYNKQIKPQQPKVKKTNETMSVLVAKNSSEFRRPPSVQQRDKDGLAKYGNVSPNQSSSATDWEVRTLTSPSATTKKPPLVIVPRINGKMDKKLPKPLPSLPISNDVLKNLPNCKISSLRLTSDSSVNNAKCSSPTTAASSLLSEPLDFKNRILSHVNENNNFTNGCGSILDALRSQTDTPISRLSSPSSSKEDEDKSEEVQTTPIDEDDVDVDEEDSRSSESKPSLSPILSAPTTIRFPARKPEKDRSQTTDSGICRWDKCEASFEAVGGLLEHLQSAHINTQTGSDNFVCHWQGCKVQGRTSCSRRWLERHVMSHGGNKPFRCIVEGCGCRFSSQTALERHVNNHFNQPETTNNGRRSCENGNKLVKRNSKKLRYRRQPRSAKRFDYFDASIMEGLQHRLQGLAASRTQGRLEETPGNSMALTSQVLGKRIELDGQTKVLLRWYPQDIEPDEWVLETEVQITKYVDIRKAVASNPEEVSLALYPAISGRAPPTTRVKQRRKPVKNS